VLQTIKNMKADGYTHVAEGVGWGLRVLSPGEPFTEGRPYNDETKKAMVLLTDGENTFQSQSNHNLSTYTAYGYLEPGTAWLKQLLDRRQTAEQPAATGLCKREGRRNHRLLVCLQRAQRNPAPVDQELRNEPREVF
jgi:hypothetical protein